MEASADVPPLASLPQFSLEEQLILCCARVDLTEADRGRLLSLTAKSLDWDALLRETIRQSLVPLVYRHLHAEVADRVPDEILGRLRAEYLRAAVRSMALAAELHAVISLLEANGIAALPYKGPVLALQAYGDIALRTFTDLDILVARKDVAAARRILDARGYEPLDRLSPAQERAVLRFDHNLPLVSHAANMVIELHWRVAPVAFTFTMPVEELWAHSTSLQLSGLPVRAMSINHLMIVLPVHGSRHAWSAVEWIVGVAELMRQPDAVNWDQVIANAEAYRVGRIVRLAVALANRLLGAPLPDEAGRWIAGDPRIEQLVAWVAQRLFAGLDVHSGTQQWALFKYEMAVRDRMIDRIRDGSRRFTFPTGKDWESAQLPDALFPLYFLVRPWRLAGRYVRRALLNR